MVFFYPLVKLQAIPKHVPVTHDKHHLFGKTVGEVNNLSPFINPVPEECLVNKDIVCASADFYKDVVGSDGVTGTADRQVIVMAAGLSRCSQVLVGLSSL